MSMDINDPVSVRPSIEVFSRELTLVGKTSWCRTMEVLINACSRSDAVSEFLNALFTPERAVLEELIKRYLYSPRGFIEFNEVMATIVRSRSHGPIHLDKFFKDSKGLEEVFGYIRKQQEFLLQGRPCESVTLHISTTSENPESLPNKCALPQHSSILQATKPEEEGTRSSTTHSYGANYFGGYRHYQPNLNPSLTSLYSGITKAPGHWDHHPSNVDMGLACAGSTRGPRIFPPLSLAQPSPTCGPLTFGFRALPEPPGSTAEIKHELNNELISVYTYNDFFKPDGSLKYPQPPPITHARDYECHECDKSYVNKRSLYNHLRIHKTPEERGAMQTPPSSESVDQEPSRKYACDVCGKRLSGEWELMLHTRTHSDFKAYGCGHCGKSYSDKGRLRTHMRSHSAHRPFKCTNCGKTFIHQGHLNRHRKYSCRIMDDMPPAELREAEEARPQSQEKSSDLRDSESPPQLLIGAGDINSISTAAEPGSGIAGIPAELPGCLSQAPLPPTPLFHFSEVYSSLVAARGDQPSAQENVPPNA